MKDKIANFSIIEIVGNVGSGKTTLSKRMSKDIKCKYINADPYLENPFLPLFIKNKSKWSFITGLHFAYYRALEASKSIKFVGKIPLVVDHGFETGLYMYSKNEFLNKQMNKDEWDFLKVLHDGFMEKANLKPNIIIFIEVDMPTIAKRLKERGRAHEQSYSKKYILELQERLNEYKLMLIQNKARETVITVSPQKKQLSVSGKPQSTIVNYLKTYFHFYES